MYIYGQKHIKYSFIGPASARYYKIDVVGNNWLVSWLVGWLVGNAVFSERLKGFF